MLASRKSVETVLCDVNFSSSCALLQIRSDKTYLRVRAQCVLIACMLSKVLGHWGH